MPYVIPDKRIAMFFCPKGGGTSLRAYMFHLENGFPFRPFRVQGQETDANALLRNLRWRFVKHDRLEGYEYFCVVRDPVRRFLSGYANRVVHYRELSEEAAGPKLAEAGLTPDPDLDTFVENFAAYCGASKSVDRHFWRQQAFLGKEAGRYARIFRLERSDEITAYFNARFGIDGALPRLQTGGPKLSWSDLHGGTRRKILDIVRDDVAFTFNPEYRNAYGLDGPE